MATYKSAKKQLAWTMQVLENEIKDLEEMTDTYARMLANAQEAGNEEDVDLWFEALDREGTKFSTLKDIYFQITHPDIFDESLK